MLLKATHLMYTLYVGGCISNLIPAKYSIRPVNHSVIFLKETDVILTNDQWHVAIDLNTDTYEEIIATIKGDLL
jgi:hypothetical protein